MLRGRSSTSNTAGIGRRFHNPLPDQPPIVPGVNSDLDLFLNTTEERLSAETNDPGVDRDGGLI